MAKVIKELIIMLLVCLLTMLVLAVVLYKYIPNRKVIPEVVKYTASEEVQDLLEDNVKSANETSENNVVLTLTSDELKGYQNSNIYVPGKANPFAAVSKSTEVNTDNNENSNGNSENNNATSNNNEQKKQNNSNESTSPSVYNSNGTK